MHKFFELVGLIVDGIKALQKFLERKKFRDADEKATTEKDQRQLEESLGGAPGPTRRKYSGLFERDRKKAD